VLLLGASSISDHTAEAVTVTILSSNLASATTVGEWGLSALVQADDACVLFDAGRSPDTVVKNADALSVDLSCVTDVVLSHFHFDHTTGLLTLLADLRSENPSAVRRVHVAEGFFLPRRAPDFFGDTEQNQMIAVRETLEAEGVEIIVHAGPAEILPSIWVTGPIPRPNPERNYPEQIKIEVDGDWVVDHVPDSQGVTIITPEGHIVLLGCGHSGVVNALEHVKTSIADRPIHALMGGLHLFNASDETLGWTADRLREIGVEHLMAGHCTGIEPLIRLRSGLNLSRRTAVVGAVGSRFVYGEGIHPTAIAM
jgi:7,8-dihydropterin-6-yl-methyl-4-(beta-D-ribofuranosyl)aminobenzene 5'-phosphate synthase